MFPVSSQTYVPTVFENYTACLETEEQRVELSLWDTSGKSVPPNAPSYHHWLAAVAAFLRGGGWESTFEDRCLPGKRRKECKKFFGWGFDDFRGSWKAVNKPGCHLGLWSSSPLDGEVKGALRTPREYQTSPLSLSLSSPFLSLLSPSLSSSPEQS